MRISFRKKYALPLAVGLSLSLSAVSVFANTLDLAPMQPAGAPAARKGDDDSKGLSEFLWQGSFDKAGDASREAEVALKKQNWKFACSQANESSTPAAQAQAARARCSALEKEIRQYGEEAGDIRATQRIFSDVSKVSDLAAVGAIGATAYAQLGKRNPNQADNLRSVASIQETAGYVSYATGAADFSMGAYAYAAQKSRFDDMEEKLKQANASPHLISRVSAAAEASKQAAYSHMMYGAGKAAFGYASMYLAKQNRKQADSLTSLTEQTPVAAPAAAVATPTVSGATGTGTGSGVIYNNNRPTFSLGNGTSIGSATDTNTSLPVFGSSGGSILRPGGREPASGSSSLGGGGGGGGGLGAALGGGKGGGASSPEASGEETAEAEATAAAAEKNSPYEINTLGAAPHYGGGGSKSSSAQEEAGAIASLLSNAIGGPESAATGVNPGQLYREATVEDAGGESQGSEAGVSSSNRSLFEVMRNKYTKIVQGGRVTGPGSVEVRN